MIRIRNKPLTDETHHLPHPAYKNNVLTGALKYRRTTRQRTKKLLSPNIVSNILWAAQDAIGGTNYKKIPLAYGIDCLRIFAPIAESAFDYTASTQSLASLTDTDIRTTSGTQSFAATTPLSLVYALDNDRIKSLRKTSRTNRSFMLPGVYWSGMPERRSVCGKCWPSVRSSSRHKP